MTTDGAGRPGPLTQSGLLVRSGPVRWIVDYDWLVLLLILPAALFGGLAALSLLLLVPLLWSLRKLVYGRFFVSTPLDLPLLLLFFMVLVSLAATSGGLVSGPKIAGLIYGLALFYAVVAFAGRSWDRLLVASGGLLICGLAVAALGLLGIGWSAKQAAWAPLLGHLPQLITLPGAPSGVNANEVAGALLWALPPTLAVAVAGLRRGNPLPERLGRRSWTLLLALIWLGVLCGGAVFLLAQSRSGLLGLLFALLLLGVAGRGYRWPAVALALLVVGGLVGAAGMFLVSADPPQVQELSGNPAALGLDSLEGRLEIWGRAVYGIEDFPLTGLGLGAFRQVGPILYPLFFAGPGTDIAHAHNLFMQTALDLGLPGLVAFVALWLVAAAMLWRTWQAVGRPAVSAHQTWLQFLALGFGGALLGTFVYSLTDAIALGARPGFIFWLLLGLIAGLHRLAVGSELSRDTLGD
jgi:putative inorganic carbon (HCO3(-)) transporter